MSGQRDITRSEHIRWCKKRALEYLPKDPAEAVTSMLSDLGKHPETAGLVPGMGMIGLASVGTAAAARRFIEGFTE